MRRSALLGAALAALATGCSDETGPNISGVPGLDIVRVEIAPVLDTLFIADTLRPGDRLPMAARVIGRTGGPIENAAVAWSSSDLTVATVTEDGVVIPTGFGTTIITASAHKIAQATIVVLPATRTVQITPGADTIFVEDPIAARDTIRFKATAFDEEGRVVTGIRFSWTSSAAGTATVDGTGLVLGRALGPVTVTARSGERVGTASVLVASAVKAIQVSSPVATLLARDTVQLSATALGYDNRPMGGRTFTWTSSDPTVATVDASGRAIFLRSGSVTFTAKSAFTTSNTTVIALERQLLSVSAGDEFVCGYTNLGRGYCWGRGDAGQLASAADSSCFADDGGRIGCTLTPKRFSGPALALTAIDAGGRSACGITADKLIYCWGSDERGQIGNGSKGGGAQPALATVAQERFDSITVGESHACALTTAGLAYCWGNDAFGQLGDDRTINSTTPIPVLGGLVFSSISAGRNHTCGIAGGQAYCWGDNEFGQLGTGGFSSSHVPVPVSGSAPFVAIASGSDHTCGLTATGAATCWGANSLGQVGTGTAGAAVTTATAAVPGSFVRISAGRNHTCAISSSGSATCWGDNSFAQAGNGSAGGVASPAIVGGVSFRTITAGERGSCGVALDGQTYCWGSNVLGGLGNELQAAFRATPQMVAVPR